MRDYDGERHFMEQIHYHMEKCQYRREIDGLGVCSLHLLPCEKVLYQGACEAVAEWYQNKEREKGESHDKGKSDRIIDMD